METLLDLCKKLSDARICRIQEGFGQWYEETNQTTFATHEPEEGLLDAYFAEKKEREVPIEGATVEVKRETYVARPGYYISTFAAEHGIDDWRKLVEANPEALPDPNHPPAEVELIIPNSEEVPTKTEEYYEPINSGSINNDSYIVIYGFFPLGTESTIIIKEKEPKLTEASPMLEVQMYENEEDTAPATTRELQAVFGDNGTAVVKLKFHPGDDETYKGWQEALSPPEQVRGASETSIRPEPRPSAVDLRQHNRDINQVESSEQDDGLEIIKDYTELYLDVTVQGKRTFQKEFLNNTDKYFDLYREIAPWMEIVWGELGVYERDRSEGGGFERVAEFFRNGAGQALHPIDNAWCSSFSNWAFIETNLKKGTNFSTIPLNGNINNPALAINWYNPQRYPGGVLLTPDKKPPYGAVFIMQRRIEREDHGLHEGHASFVVDYKKSESSLILKLLGGNQSDKVQVETYVFEKSGSEYIKGDFKLLGYVLPQEYLYEENNEVFYQYQSEAPSNDAGSIQ